MEKIVLQAQVREVTGKQVKRHREEGLVPAVLYGHKVAPKNLWVPFLDFSRVYNQAGENTILELQVGKEKSVNVLIHDIQTDPLSGNFSHADFFQVRMDEEIEASIPLEFEGEAPAVKEQGGVLVKSLDEVEVKCLPAHLPHSIVVDISTLKTFDDRISVGDLKIPAKVEVLGDPETVVALVTPPRSEEELAELDTKVEVDVTKVEGVVKETPATEEKK
jgi:large subunit ribosomal protein L25